MTNRSLLIFAALTFSTIGIASAKSYSVTLTSPTRVGSTELKPGAYEVKVAGTEAVFTNEDGKSFKVPVTIGQNEKKFDNTAVEAAPKDGKDTLQEIDLGGSTTKLQFAQ